MSSTKAQTTVIQQDISGTFTDIGNISGFSGLQGGSAAVINTTNLQSTAKEKLVGLPDEGQVQFDIKFANNASYQALRTVRASQALTEFKIIIPASEASDPTATAKFKGYVTSLPLSGSVDGIIEASTTIEITGAITWT